MDRDPLGIYDDPIIIRFQIPWLIGNDAAEGGTDQLRPVDPAPGETAQLHPVTNPPSSAALVARWREGLAETAAEEAARRASMPDSRLIMGGVRSHPGLAVSGSSDGEVTLWRRGSDAAAPQALAALTLDLDGSQLFAGGQFVGRWFETWGEALFLPDWLHEFAGAHVQLASDEPGEGAGPEDPEKQLLEEVFKHLEQAVPPLGGGRPLPAPGERRDPVLQPPVPVVPSPAGGRPGPAPTPRPVPLGFANPESFARFGRQLYAGLESAGYPDVYAAVRGSAVTGESFRTGAPFDVGRRSDLDVALASPTLFQRARELGIALRSAGHRTKPLDPDELRALGLMPVVQVLRQRMARRISIMIYDLPAFIEQRGVNLSIPR